MDTSLSPVARKRAVCSIFLPILLLYCVSYFQRTAVPGQIFDPLQKDIGLSPVDIAVVTSSFIYVYAIAQIFVGMLVDRLGGMRVVLLGGLIFTIGSVWFPLTCSFPVMCIARGCTALGASTLYLGLMRETDRIFSHDKYAMLLSLIFFVGYCGGLIGTLPFERLIHVVSWQGALLGVGILTAVFYGLFLCGFFKAPQAAIVKAPFSLRPLWRVMCNRNTWLSCWCCAITFGAYSSIQMYLGKKFLQDYAGMSSPSASLCIFMLTIVCTVILLMNGVIAKWMHNKRRPVILATTGICLLNTCLMTVAISFDWPGWVFAMCYQVYALTSGMTVTMTILVQELNEEKVMTQSAALSNCICYLAMAGISLVMGMVLTSFTPEGVTAEAIHYPKEAYLRVFTVLLAITASSFVAGWFIPETHGKYCDATK